MAGISRAHQEHRSQCCREETTALLGGSSTPCPMLPVPISVGMVLKRSQAHAVKGFPPSASPSTFYFDKQHSPFYINFYIQQPGPGSEGEPVVIGKNWFL